jgi:exopolyphosphatase/guanosine-5'-triphosphate,3'-diphosphate pyrophosphatase
MAKRTAIIDIGSNSARLVIFEKTSRYGFHLICEQKSKVRIGEGAYEKNGYLQPVGIKRAFLTLQSFLHTIEKYQAHKTICVATSALRDAPNGPLFVTWIKKELGLSIKVIDGKKEAAYGAIAVKNLLPVRETVTIDIGGGSADLALIKNGKIIDTYSLNVGTVRLKELFFDKETSRKDAYTKAKAYTHREIQKLPPHFKAVLAVGIGGTARTLSKGIMKRTKYPLDKLHAFTYEIDTYQSYLERTVLTLSERGHLSGWRSFHI